MATMTIERPFSCSSCMKTFTAKAHLKRHFATHTNLSPYACEWCQKGFKRSDVMREHLTRCRQRGYSALPPSASRGRARRSCDLCARRKIRCSGTIPCEQCQKSSSMCIKGVTQAPGSVDTTASESDALTMQERISIETLLNADNPSDFIQRFPMSERKYSEQSMTGGDTSSDLSPRNNLEVMPEIMQGNFSNPFGDVAFDQSGGGLVDLDFFFDNLHNGVFGPPDPEFIMDPSQVHPDFSMTPMSLGNPLHKSGSNNTVFIPPALEQRSIHIKYLLHKTLMGLPQSERPADILPLLKAIDDFTPMKMQCFAELYLSNWQKHAPILHTPSFDLAKTATPLLLSVCAIGGLYASAREDVEQIKLLLDLIEAVAFDVNEEDEWRMEDISEDNMEDKIATKKLEEVQGLYLLVVAQFFSGNRAAKRRARTNRFSTAVMKARDISLPTIHHDPNMTIATKGDWDVWVHTECSIRTMNMLLMIDKGMSVFSNVPARFELSEIDLQLPCYEPDWERSYYTFTESLLPMPSPRSKVLEAYESLFKEGDNQGTGTEEAKAYSAFDLQILIHMLYGTIWQRLYADPTARFIYATSNGLMRPLKNAVLKWKAIWEDLKARSDPDDWAVLGFHGYADRYWAIVKGLVWAFETRKNGGTASGMEPVRADCDESGAHLKAILMTKLRGRG